MIKKPIYFTQFENYAVEIMFDICFSFMRTFNYELHEMRDNPYEFVRIALDTADQQKLPVLKSQAAKLLESMTDKIPEMS